MDANDLKGLPVITIEGGDKVGNVSAILFNTADYRIQAFLMGGGFLSSPTELIEMANVQSIGSNAVMIQNRAAIQHHLSNQEREQYPSLEDITSLPIVTKNGSVVGKVAAVEIDPQTGNITELLAAKPGLTGVFESRIHVPVNQLISIGRDAVIVPDRFGEKVVS